jgi:hypothetical protein
MATNSGDSLTGRLGHKMFPFEDLFLEYSSAMLGYFVNKCNSFVLFLISLTIEMQILKM